jgi:1-acyl-sn-glycerol-3-phosphate acyltransferase
MYFVASEHVLRLGPASRLLKVFFNPITRIKGRTDAQAVMEILRRLKNGSSVCIFAEGNRSFSGVTGPIIPSTGKLVRVSGAALITYRLRGGYLATPRWAARMRKGPLWGAPVGVYLPGELKTMSPDQINALIQRDIFEDAYQTMENLSPRPVYRSRTLAENLETALYLCPHCLSIGRLSSRDDRLFCDCGMDWRYDEQGILHTKTQGDRQNLPNLPDIPTLPPKPFTTVRDWWFWQQETIKALADEGDLYVSDENQALYEVQPGKGSALLEKGRLSLGREGLACGSRRFDLKKISELAIHGQRTLIFSAAGKQYELRSKTPRSAAKYQHIFNLLTRRQPAPG